MSIVETGKTIRVHYKGKLTNGEVFDSSEGREPLEFTVGQGSLIKGFENGVLGMKVGNKKVKHNAKGPKIKVWVQSTFFVH